MLYWKFQILLRKKIYHLINDMVHLNSVTYVAWQESSTCPTRRMSDAFFVQHDMNLKIISISDWSILFAD